MNEVICDISDVYLSVLKDDGTYLTKKETIRWVIDDYLIGRLIFSIHKHILRFNVASEGLVTPTGYWYLPDFQDGKVVMPLAKVMRWIYEESGMSQTGFHSLQPKVVEEVFETDRRLNNAQNWIKGNGLPSLSSLMMNFSRPCEGGTCGKAWICPSQGAIPLPVHDNSPNYGLFWRL
ncbi:hypothetical protein [Herbaspirillum sp. NPDC087042]|uniref:hypothetical protein n=1 Tax=Herbaspirillum sp. NPDC087042 TaxID=3364004 RepID=UPI003802E977